MKTIFNKLGAENLIGLVLIGLALLVLYSMLHSGAVPNYQLDAQRAVEAQGYTSAQYVGVDYFACGKPSGYAFDADNSNGARVHLVACSRTGLINPTSGWYLVTR
jgi:hypothetical protein